MVSRDKKRAQTLPIVSPVTYRHFLPVQTSVFVRGAQYAQAFHASHLTVSAGDTRCRLHELLIHCAGRCSCGRWNVMSWTAARTLPIKERRGIKKTSARFILYLFPFFYLCPPIPPPSPFPSPPTPPPPSSDASLSEWPFAMHSSLPCLASVSGSGPISG